MAEDEGPVPSGPRVDDSTPIGRRIFLGSIGVGAVGVAVGSRVQSAVSSAFQPIADADPTGVTDLLPASSKFRIYSVVADDPTISEETFQLVVDGLVTAPVTLSYDDLLARDIVSLTRDFQCVTGWRVPDVEWSGVRVATLLDEVGTTEEATHVRFHSADGVYTTTLTLDQARRPDVLVAHRMLGDDVRPEHGGPVRLYVAPMYGYKSLKWLSRIEVSDSGEPPGFWEERGYDTDAWVGASNGRQGDEPTS